MLVSGRCVPSFSCHEESTVYELYSHSTMTTLPRLQLGLIEQTPAFI